MTKQRREKTQTRQNIPNDERFIRRVLALPRLARIGITAFFALMSVLAISPIIDEIYLRFLYTPGTVIAPSLVSMSIGLGMYLVGWVLIVGTVEEENPARKVILWYFVVGALALCIVGLWLIRLLMLGSASLS